ncbi:MAG: hypothetical protein ABJO02_11150 [Reichenbachiella sp.]|uniref:hypothetical protein n=1 Tax=Reichenbachiella sp. TaxID=2184521 RepID=UPI003299E181
MKRKYWTQPCFFYVLRINGTTKFGITKNWENRMKQYKRDYRYARMGFNCTVHYREVYPEYWQAEFVETMLRRRLKPWVEFGHEYISSDVPTQNVINFYLEIKSFLIDYNSFEHVKTYYKIGSLRMKLYKLYYIELTERLEKIPVI